ncbi:MAG: riboflavin synthase [Ferruginibacter sp.]
MFTGIIETIAEIEEIIAENDNKIFWLSSKITHELKIDQSVSHNGVCLTVEQIQSNKYRVCAITETLNKTCLNNWQTGNKINLERSMMLNGRLDGHIVQGHVDTTANCTEIVDRGGSFEYTFQLNENYSDLIIEKGSISVNGISLTIFNIGKSNFTVCIIPYTYENTNMKYLQMGDCVNIEFDMVGKYIKRSIDLINFR